MKRQNETEYIIGESREEWVKRYRKDRSRLSKIADSIADHPYRFVAFAWLLIVIYHTAPLLF